MPIVVAVVGSGWILGFVLDVAVLHGPRLRRRRVVKSFGMTVAFVGAAIAGLVYLLTANSMNVTKLRPFFAVLRAGPTKTLGVAAMFALVMLPIAWPWMRAWRFHAAPTRLAYTLLWLASAIGWIALAVLGGAAPTPTNVAWSLALTLYELAFLLVLPFVLGRFVPGSADERVEVFV